MAGFEVIIYGRFWVITEVQATDLFAWTCYQEALSSRFNKPIHRVAKECALEYGHAMGGAWRTVQSLNRDGVIGLVKQMRYWTKNSRDYRL